MSEKPGNPVVAILMAIAVAGVIVFLVDALANQVIPLPTGINPTDPGQLKAALEEGEVPWLGMGLMLGGWLLGAYAGGRVAISVGKREWVVMVFAAVFTALVVSYLMNVPNPVWMWIGGAAGCPIVAIGAAGAQISVRT